MIDLCLLGMYSDDMISLAEQDFMEDESAHLHWESGISFNGYLQRTIPKVRSIKHDPPQLEAMLQNIRDRLGREDLKQAAVQELEKLLATDGLVQPETDFLAQVKRIMAA